ncbi:type II secretion system GspH family protein [Arhodomonas aquaeolei]|uniref:type II secretion system protein n=1 Tax=Arhodomonas aquaeolei TaxID=2369 RepID=UPI002166CD27|nr:type II secretion system protein [Arhodomonas aquaeolei]MCS4504250.1 type II secretion system GspH family protein [Arhodomonas aquaeolei]
MTRVTPARGFSLIELAVVLVVLGTIAVATWRLVPLALEAGTGGDRAASRLAGLQSAVEGFVLRRHRLPCPDSDGDGAEDCGGDAIGRVPWQSLGVDPPDAPVRYGADTGGSDLTALPAATAYTPELPRTHDDPVNGLDFCRNLLDRAPDSGLTIGAHDTVAAYALAHPGDDGRYQGLNAAAGFELPGQRRDGDNDDRVIAVGPAELAGKLGCTRRLARSNIAARAAFAAYDLDRVAGYEGHNKAGSAPVRIDAGMYLRFRDLALHVRRGNEIMAGVRVAIAGVSLANAIGTSASAIALAATSKGSLSAPIAAAVVGIGAAAAQVAAASVQVGLAVDKVATAEENICNAIRFAEQVKFEDAAADPDDPRRGRELIARIGLGGVASCNGIGFDDAGDARHRFESAVNEDSGGLLP